MKPRFGTVGRGLALAVPLALACAGGAQAGTYQVAMCDLGVGPAQFERFGSQGQFAIDHRCGEGGALRVGDVASNWQQGGAQAGWRVSKQDAAPRNLTPTRIAFKAAGRADKGLRPFVEGKRRGKGAWKRIAAKNKLSGRFADFAVARPYKQLRVVLRCISKERCASDSAAFARLKAVRWSVAESVRPQEPELGGAILRQPVQRASQSVAATTGDGQSGVKSVAIRVNDTHYATLPGSCQDGDGSAAISRGAWRPCENTVAGRALNTNDGGLPFREGLNSIGACARDFAANTTCAPAQVIRVDNRCPIPPPGDTAAPPASLRAAFANGKTRKRVRFGARPAIQALLQNAAGQPLATTSASICVTRRIDRVGSLHTKLLQPLLPSGGSLRLPKGPSRELFVDYWLNTERVRSARFRILIRPRVRLGGEGAERPGSRLRLRARLGGPHHGRRKVVFRAIAGKRKVRLGADRTNKRGIARARPRLRGVGSRHRIRVKAIVPKQQGYPYEIGRSRAIKVRVAR